MKSKRYVGVGQSAAFLLLHCRCAGVHLVVRLSWSCFRRLIMYNTARRLADRFCRCRRWMARVDGAWLYTLVYLTNWKPTEWNPVRVSVWNEDDDGVSGSGSGSRSIQPWVGLPSSSTGATVMISGHRLLTSPPLKKVREIFLLGWDNGTDFAFWKQICSFF